MYANIDDTQLLSEHRNDHYIIFTTSEIVNQRIGKAMQSIKLNLLLTNSELLLLPNLRVHEIFNKSWRKEMIWSRECL